MTSVAVLMYSTTCFVSGGTQGCGQWPLSNLSTSRELHNHSVVWQEVTERSVLGTVCSTDIQDRSRVNVDGIEEDDAIWGEGKAPLNVYGSAV